MHRVLPAALALLTLLPSSPAWAQDEAAHLRTGRAFALAQRATEAWEAAATDRSYTVRQELLAFAGASELAARRLADRRTDDVAAAQLLTDLERLADSVQSAVDRERTSGATREAWAQARRALVALGDSAATTSPGGRAEAEPEPAPETPSSRLETPPADPDAPRAVISDSRWSGTFTPDLVVSGRVEGRGLRSGALIVRDSSGREVHRAEKEIAEAIAAATQGDPADALATAVFSVRIDDDRLASGENTVVIVVTDAKGRTAEASRTFTKRLF